MKTHSRLQRCQQVQFAVGIAALDGGKPTAFTKKLLTQYENGQVTSSELRQAIIEKYTQASS